MQMNCLFMLFISMVCLGITIGLAERAVAAGTGLERASVAIPRAGEVVSGISVTLEAPAPHYLDQRAPANSKGRLHAA
jgi:hypothetical protein